MGLKPSAAMMSKRNGSIATKNRRSMFSPTIVAVSTGITDVVLV